VINLSNKREKLFLNGWYEFIKSDSRKLNVKGSKTDEEKKKKKENEKRKKRKEKEE
jgi:hypothetical protein